MATSVTLFQFDKFPAVNRAIKLTDKVEAIQARMPSASNVKVDKQVNSENASLPESSTGTTSVTPLRQVITLVEHKIRNLEKRKSKLESYRDLQDQGKELNADQKTAIAKFSEVCHTLEFARDIYKQFLSIAMVSEKEEKKKAKKEAAAKNQAELARLREILLVQDALNQMGNESVREDFLNGRNGAAQLTETDLKLLDDLYPAVTPKHEAGNPTAFTNEVQAAAEHLLAAVDGKQKEVFGGSYSQIKEVLGKIHESGYFDQVQVFEAFVEETSEQQVEGEVEMAPQLEQLPAPIDQLTVDEMAVQSQAVPAPQAILEQPPLPDPQQQQMFYQHPPPRPITEMLGGTGSFFFLQESEIDTPPEQIPSQTFTNQNYVAAVVPPPPIPLPPMFQPQPQQAPLSMGAAPVPPNPTRHPNGGYKVDDGKVLVDDLHKPMRQQQHRPSNNQSYYQNNGYNSRPKQQRNGGGGGSGSGGGGGVGGGSRNRH